MRKVSVVVVIRNQIEYNRLFLSSLEKSSAVPYELIVVDNGSTDGSAEFFESHGATVLRNGTNHCYGCSQNRGIAHASADYIACLNNDIRLSPMWDARLVAHMEEFGLDVLSPCGIETMETEKATRRSMRKWRLINHIQRLRMSRGWSYRESDLRLLLRVMYGNWEKFTEDRYRRFRNFLYPGIAGNAVLIRRSVFDRIGPWSTEVNGSDWDFQLRLLKRRAENGDVRPSMIAGDVFVHHFIRATGPTVKRIPQCDHPLRDIAAVWPRKDHVYLRKPGLSLIVAFAGGRAAGERLLGALSGQSMTDFEIIMVESVPDPETAPCIERWQSRFPHPIVRIVPPRSAEASPEWSMVSEAVDRARSDYLCFMEADGLPGREFLAGHFRSRRIGVVVTGEGPSSGEGRPGPEGRHPGRGSYSVFTGDLFRYRAAGGCGGKPAQGCGPTGLFEQPGIRVRQLDGKAALRRYGDAGSAADGRR
jgi:GT2 family glycosyltransferase